MATSSDVIKSFTIKVNTDNGKVKIQGLTKAFVDADVAMDRMTSGVQQNTTALNQNAQATQGVSAATGGATAVSLEFGRVISDAPYGIRGVANNLSQMGTQFFQLRGKVDKATGKVVGFGGALKAVRGAMMGPIGILIAFQAVIAAVDYFAGGMKKGAEDVDDMNESLKDQITSIKLLEEQMLIVGDNQEKRMAIAKGLARTDKAMRKAIKDANGDKEKEIENIKKLRKQKELELALREKEFEIMTQNTEYERAAKRASEIESGERLFVGFENYSATIGNRNEALEAREKATAEYLELLKGLEEEEVKVTGKALAQAKRFKAKYLDLFSDIQKQKMEMALIGIENEQKLLALDEQNIEEELENKYESYKQKEKLRLDAYLISIKGKKNEYAEAKRAQRAFDLEMIQAEQDFGIAKQAIIDNFEKQRKFKQAETDRATYEIMADDILNIIGRLDTAGDDVLNEWNEKRIKRANEIKEESLTKNLDAAVEGGNEVSIMEAARELADFQYQIQEEELTRDNQHYADKQKIIQDYLGYAKTIGNTLQAIAGDNEGIQKAGLLIAKGAGTADVVINANKQMMANKTARDIRNVAAAGNPAALAASGAMYVKDKIQTVVGAGASIASIWGTSINKKNKVGSGGSGGSNGGRTFDFNLVGSTGENQAAQVTAGALGQPVQAYVVSADITNQQQLDSNIQGQASFDED